MYEELNPSIPVVRLAAVRVSVAVPSISGVPESLVATVVTISWSGERLPKGSSQKRVMAGGWRELTTRVKLAGEGANTVQGIEEHEHVNTGRWWLVLAYASLSHNGYKR